MSGPSPQCYVCENCGTLGPIGAFQAECRPGWTHGRLIKVNLPRRGNEMDTMTMAGEMGWSSHRALAATDAEIVAAYDAAVERGIAAYKRVVDEYRAQDSPPSRDVVEAVLRAAGETP